MEPRLRMSRLTLIIVFLLAVAGLVLLLNNLFPGSLSDPDNQLRIVYSLILLSVVGSSILLTLSHQNIGTSLRHALIWIGIVLILVIGYSYRDVFEELPSRVGAELTPSSPRTLEPGVVRLIMADNGHFYANSMVNGRRVRFLVDTGATSVALTRDDAIRAGIDVNELLFNQPISTANGTNFAARVRLDSIEIGDIELRRVPATVVRDGLDQSLLGMSFLGALSGIETRGNSLILRQ